MVLPYPVSETLYSILRKTLRKGYGPGRVDKAHLIYRNLRRALRGTTAVRYANPAVGALLWGAMAASLVFVSAAPHTRAWAFPALGVQAALYLGSFRRENQHDRSGIWRRREITMVANVSSW